MFIPFDSLGETVGEVEGESAVVEHGFGRMDDAVVGGREDDDIAGIIIQALREGADMVCLDHFDSISVANLLARHLATVVVDQLVKLRWNMEAVCQQRPIHRTFEKKCIHSCYLCFLSMNYSQTSSNPSQG